MPREIIIAKQTLQQGNALANTEPYEAISCYKKAIEMSEEYKNDMFEGNMAKKIITIANHNIDEINSEKIEKDIWTYDKKIEISDNKPKIIRYDSKT